jgi:Tfp pilus assembly protein PilX
MSRGSKKMIKQQGIALVIGLIMLVLMTLLAIAAFNIGSSQTAVVNNAQYKNEATAAAQTAIDMVINSSNFTTNPAAAITGSNCGTGTNVLCVDTNGDGNYDVTVNLATPTCIAATPIPTSQLDFTKSDDLACSAGTQQTFGTSGSVSGNSLCANSTWEVDATATDPTTNTTAEVVQGVGVRIAATDMSTYCP